MAKTNCQPKDEPAATNWTLATTVLQRDKKESWGILDNPHRLRIQTIDGLCSSISRQMPISAKLGAAPQIKEDCQDEYHEAAKATLAAAYQTLDWTGAVATLLTHMDNDLNRLEELLSSLLAKREQWLPHIIPYCVDSSVLRDHLEQALSLIIEDLLIQAAEYIESVDGLSDRIIPLAKFSAEQLLEKSKVDAKDKMSPIVACTELENFLNADSSAVDLWLGIVELFTAKEKTRTKRWRKATARSVTAKIGFPTGKEFAYKKQQMISLLEELSEQHAPLLEIFEKIAVLPPNVYGENQWEIVEALLQVLPIAVAQLNIVFQREGIVDYSEVSQSALHALGSVSEPSELALKMDYQIRHVLIDEFQDTSVTQFSLLEKLTIGWQMDDGRTLFIVGDPMQSIYRFREADVSLFLRAKKFGVGDISLESLVLTSNFRSNESIVHWVNSTFEGVFPAKENLTTGAVTYSPSDAARGEQPIIDCVHYGLGIDDKMQVEKLVEFVAERRDVAPDETIALLVRAKAHVLPIAALFREKCIPYHAVEIESLIQAPFIQDLFSLTKAMLHLGDRIAWLSLLRGPFCSLDLNDLLLTSGANSHGTIWEKLEKLSVNDASVDNVSEYALSEAGLLRVRRLVSVMSRSFTNRGRGYLRDWVESTWVALGGLHLVGESQLEDAEQFFVLLEKMEEGGVISDMEQLERKMSGLFASAQPSENNPIQIMTVHKSKGLEFDTVILPSVEKKGRSDDSPLLAWSRQDIANEDWLLLAPIKEAGTVSEPIYQYIRHLESEKAKWELVRLFYVAATRAKKRIALFATLKYDEAKDEIKVAASGSLQKFVEKPFQSLGLELVEQQKLKGAADRIIAKTYLKRLHQGSRLSLDAEFGDLYCSDQVVVAKHAIINGSQLLLQQMQQQPSSMLKAESGSEKEEEKNAHRLLGVFVHNIFDQLSLRLASSDAEVFDGQWINKEISERWFTSLVNMGVTPVYAEMLLPTAIKAVYNWCRNKTLRTLTDNSTLKASELVLSCVEDSNDGGDVKKVILDRLLVDQYGIHWVVDYKILVDDGDEGKVSAAIDTYRSQLENYARIISQMKGNEKTLSGDPIKCALYFPVTDLWHAWDYSY